MALCAVDFLYSCTNRLVKLNHYHCLENGNGLNEGYNVVSHSYEALCSLLHVHTLTTRLFLCWFLCRVDIETFVFHFSTTVHVNCDY